MVAKGVKITVVIGHLVPLQQGGGDMKMAITPPTFSLIDLKIGVQCLCPGCHDSLLYEDICISNMATISQWNL